MKGNVHSTKDAVLRFNPEEIHLIMPYQGTRYSISVLTMTDMGKLTQQDLDFLLQLGFPS